MVKTEAHVLAEKIIGALGNEPEPSMDSIENVMRPLGIVRSETGFLVKHLLSKQGHKNLALRIGAWYEANIVVSGEGKDREKRILFLLKDTCSCVLAQLPNAVMHATGPVDPRVLSLLDRRSGQNP